MKKCLAVLGALFFLAASAGASAIYNFSVNATSKSALTNFSLTCSGMPTTCAGIQASEVSVTSGPATGATLSSITVGSTLDVAVFADSFGQFWTFSLDTTAITGMKTYTFTSSSTVSYGSSGSVAASGALAIAKATAMPEHATFWTLLLVLIPVVFVCWRQGRARALHSPAL
ncbi:MAG TPA: hypothetical protein VMT20_11395 [Terriglobia bacterium]|nr:hypothetical protein [Terriglobia bacterium]